MRAGRRTRRLCVLAVVMSTAAVAPSLGAATPPSEELEEIREEIADLRREYVERLASLEARLVALEGSARDVAPQPAAPAPITAAPGGLPQYGNVAASSKVFNPHISVIGNFLGTIGSSDGSEPPSLVMDEVEATFRAVVDPYARADFFFAFGPEGVEVEESYITFPTLPGGLLMKAGKLRASFGKVNTLHTHAIPWADRPLLTQNLVGGDEGLADAGISLSRLIPNDLLFLEATAEVFRGESEGLFEAPTRGDLTYVGRLRGYRDITDSTNLDLGGSFAQGHNDAGPGLETRLIGADLTFRYRPLRRAIYRRFLARAELVWSRREEPEAAQNAFGAYASGEYQFARRWFVGARYDYAERAAEARLADEGFSGTLTFWPSEFSQLRGQYRRTRFGEGHTTNEVLFQLLFNIGAHGAHEF
jgi:hypothetical protein